MEKSQVSMQLRQVVVSMLNELAHESLNVDASELNNKWFWQKICFFVENNFLTYQEMNDLFGWTSSNDAEDYAEVYSRPTASSGFRNRMSVQDIQKRVMAMIGAVSVKYRLSVSLQVFEPIVHVVVEVRQEKNEAKWHVPLDEFQWFRDLSVRARNGIKNLNCKILGDLVVLTPKELRIPNFGPKSREEVEQALQFEGFWLGMLTRHEYKDHLDRIDMLENDET